VNSQIGVVYWFSLNRKIARFELATKDDIP
jgi:hypothetical protein